MSIDTFPSRETSLTIPLSIANGGTGGDDAAEARTNLGLGTMAQQDASAVAITGGVATLGGHTPTGVLDVQSSVVASDFANRHFGVRVWPVAPSGSGGVIGVRVEPVTGPAAGSAYFRGLHVEDPPLTTADSMGVQLLVSAGTNRYNIFALGTAQNYFGGPIGGQRLFLNEPMSTDRRLGISYARGTEHGIVLRPSDDTSSTNAIMFMNTAQSYVGGISTTPTATVYATSSDARLKHAITPLTGALDVVRGLHPVTHLWRADNSKGVGFLAHEVADVVDGVVTGERDAIDDEGRILPQQIDHSKLVPYLTGALKEALALIDALQVRVAALEAGL